MALGSDWSPSGSKNLLGELKVAWLVSEAARRACSRRRDLVAMATGQPGPHAQVGRGARLDRAGQAGRPGGRRRPVGRPVRAPAQRPARARVTLVVVDGQPRVRPALAHGARSPPATRSRPARVGGLRAGDRPHRRRAATRSSATCRWPTPRPGWPRGCATCPSSPGCSRTPSPRPPPGGERRRQPRHVVPRAGPRRARRHERPSRARRAGHVPGTGTGAARTGWRSGRPSRCPRCSARSTSTRSPSSTTTTYIDRLAAVPDLTAEAVEVVRGLARLCTGARPPAGAPAGAAGSGGPVAHCRAPSAPQAPAAPEAPSVPLVEAAAGGPPRPGCSADFLTGMGDGTLTLAEPPAPRRPGAGDARAATTCTCRSSGRCTRSTRCSGCACCATGWARRPTRPWTPRSTFHTRAGRDLRLGPRPAHQLPAARARSPGRTAFLPFLVERCFDAPTAGRRDYIVTEGGGARRRIRTFVPEVEISHWNGVPMRRRRRGERRRAQAGSNPAARFARGLDALTIRPLRAHAAARRGLGDGRPTAAPTACAARCASSTGWWRHRRAGDGSMADAGSASTAGRGSGAGRRGPTRWTRPRS